MGFKENLKEAMFCKNITTAELAELTGINSGTISSYLKTKGSMPPADKALKMAEALDVSIDFLVNGFEKKSKGKTVPTHNFSVEVYKLAKDLSELEKDELNAVKTLLNVLRKK